MSDVRLLLKEKADIETAMQRDLAPHIRVFAQQELDKVCKKIEEASAEWNKLFEQQELDQLKQRVAALEASNKELLEALEFCCYRTTPGADCYCQHGQGLVKLGHCSEESYCHVWQTIQKERGEK